MSNYWTSVMAKRLSRRRSLTLASGAAAGAAFLAACGGSSNNNSSSGSSASGSSASGSSASGVSGSTAAPSATAGASGSSGSTTSSLITKPQDTTAQAQKGGALKTYITTDAGGWDPHLRGAWFGTLGGVVYSRLTIVKPGAGMKSSGEIVGDTAASWETSPDGLTLTMKLRPNAHWHPVAPVNGRAVDAQDVLFTWDRWKKISNTRATIANEINPDAPVMSMTAPDNTTVVMKLAFPAVIVPSLFSASVGQAFHLMPREADSGYNPKTTAIGNGPFWVSTHEPSARVVVTRNDGYHISGQPYFDTMEYPILTEYATGIAAFKNGQLYQYAVTAEDILQTKSDVSALNMYQTDLTLPTASAFFGYKATDGGMFRDKRLRQAYSMSVDRDLFAETWFNVSKFTKAGLPVDTAWSTAVPADEYAGWWLDPQSSAFGPNGQFYKHDVANAKKLMAAAGFPDGVTYKSTRAGGNYGPAYDQQIDLTEGMVADAGFKPQANVVNYQTDLIPNYESVQGEFEGIAWMLRPQSSSDPIEKLAEFMFSGSGANFIGFDTAGKGDHSGDPTVDDLIRKSRTEPDTKKRIAIMADIQKYLADAMYIIRPPSGATGFDLAWPAWRNYLWFRGARRSEEMNYFWLDKTQKPLA